jgi:RNA polymerase sigma-70 factor (ECF subfamily)
VTAFFVRRGREPQTVAGLTSDTFVEAMTSYAGFDPGKGTARGWLFAIAGRAVGAGHRPDHRTGGRIDAERAGRELIDRIARLPAGH